MNNMNLLPNNDGKRLAGPANSLPYSVYQVKEEGSQESRKRSEGRQDNAHRKMFLSTGVISRAKGSAYIEQVSQQSTRVQYRKPVLAGRHQGRGRGVRPQGGSETQRLQRHRPGEKVE